VFGFTRGASELVSRARGDPCAAGWEVWIVTEHGFCLLMGWLFLGGVLSVAVLQRVEDGRW